jgi:hypothetical protein
LFEKLVLILHSDMNSPIKRKGCKCFCEGCYPTLGYGGWNYRCAPKEIIDKVGTKRQVAQRNRNARNRVSNLLKKDSDADKTKLLALADKLFGDYIKKRDSDKDGNITCVCCKQKFNLSDKTNDGSSYIVQPLHFVSRSVYSQRFNENQVYAGCCFCNLKMYLHPEGKEVEVYQIKLIETLGIVEVMRMVAQKRNVNKLSVADIKEVIQKYTP